MGCAVGRWGARSGGGVRGRAVGCAVGRWGARSSGGVRGRAVGCAVERWGPSEPSACHRRSRAARTNRSGWWFNRCGRWASAGRTIPPRWRSPAPHPQTPRIPHEHVRVPAPVLAGLGVSRHRNTTRGTACRRHSCTTGQRPPTFLRESGTAVPGWVGGGYGHAHRVPSTMRTIGCTRVPPRGGSGKWASRKCTFRACSAVRSPSCAAGWAPTDRGDGKATAGALPKNSA